MSQGKRVELSAAQRTGVWCSLEGGAIVAYDWAPSASRIRPFTACWRITVIVPESVDARF